MRTILVMLFLATVVTLYDRKKLGILISLDDFGTGHSSLAYVKQFPIDTLKIDQFFVRDVTRDPLPSPSSPWATACG